MRIKLLLIFLIGLLQMNNIAAQDIQDYEKHVLIDGTDTLPYRVLLPVNYRPSEKYPLLLFLHGAGERGNDNMAQLVHGGKLFVKDSIRLKFPAIVVFPQCPQNSFWSNVDFKMNGDKRVLQFKPDGEPTAAMRMLLLLLPKLQKDFSINKSQVYVGGLSMGGMGTFELVNRMPKTFAAAFAVCGGGNTASAKQLSKTAWWIFHGEEDPIVPYQLSLDMYEAIRQTGAEVRMSLYPTVDHSSWDIAFKEKELLGWLFKHKK